MTPFAPCFSGFYGKLPARGDFVRAGLPGDAVDAFDGWARASLAESRRALGEEWRDCWMEASVWRFRLA
ncbi:MAG TPA: type VI secretion system-associated protein TagF, partial [Acetobacteraceae bacterium]|nr:type VI secretion system-associated protein TagF [Acetobacteraceae bacterium]